jgi:hypothetical protein
MRIRLRAWLRFLWAVPLIALFLLSAQPVSAV